MKGNEVILPTDNETLHLLYGRNKSDPNMSIQSMRERHFSPHQQALYDSVSSKENFRNRSRQHNRSEQYIQNFNSPKVKEVEYESYRIMSEERPETSNVEVINRPLNALSELKNKRHFSLPRIRNIESTSKMSQSRTHIPTYFKDAAVLLASRIQKQIHKSFYIIREYSDCKYLDDNIIAFKYRPTQQQPNINIIQPYNEAVKMFDHSEDRIDQSIEAFHRQRKVISPTEFLYNNDDFGKLKESNDTIFSFGTTRKGQNSRTSSCDQRYDSLKGVSSNG